MEWLDVVSEPDELPIFLPPLGSERGPPRLVFERGGIAIPSAFYQPFEELVTVVKRALKRASILPAVDGWHPTDVFGEIVATFGKWTLMWPAATAIMLVLCDLKG